VRIERTEIEETGVYDLDGLFIRLGLAIDSIGAKRVVLDTLETIFAGFSNQAILRSELRRLFRWLKDRGMTAVITGERGDGQLTRYGLEEYVSDCVILLEHRVNEGLAARLLRVVKYRGSRHGNDEYPFLIDEDGIWVMPVTSVGLGYDVPREFISSGVPRLDHMLNGKGFYRGSSILISGTAGSGKTSLAAIMADSVCRAGERCLYLAYEESQDQIIRNMASIGINLKQWVDQGLLHFHNSRTTLYGPEMHLLTIQKLSEEFQPALVIIDPISNLTQVASTREAKTVMVRLIDFFKLKQITTLFTNLTQGGMDEESTEIGISSLMDVWILLRDAESSGERNRLIYLLKARGIGHSNQVREFRLTDCGIEIIDVYVGAGGVLTGSARLNQDAADAALAAERAQAIERKRRDLERKRRALQTQIEALQVAFESEGEELNTLIRQDEQRERVIAQNRVDLAGFRRADADRQETAPDNNRFGE
jgi:circadian clock protein KaiC